MSNRIDPLAGMPFMHVWRDCVWAARIPALSKLVLLRIGCFVDGDGKGCSMSYAQLAYDCNISERQAKRLVDVAKDFLTKKTAGGRKTAKGRENLYAVRAPQSLVDELRAARLAKMQAEITEALKRAPAAPAGVSNSHPLGASRGVHMAHVHCPDYQRVVVEGVEGGNGPSATPAAKVDVASFADWQWEGAR